MVEAKVNARWSLDFVHDQFAQGRRFRILKIVDDVTRECLAAIPDISVGWDLEPQASVTAPAYDGLLDLTYAEPLR